MYISNNKIEVLFLVFSPLGW